MSDLNERAAKVLGWERCANGKNTYCYHDEKGLLHITEANFAKDISQAWLLVDRVLYSLLWIDIRQDNRGLWDVGIWREGERLKKWYTAETAPEAITAACVEALEAL